MTDIKKPMKSDERTDLDAEKLRRESRHQDENAPRRDVSDEDVGQDRIQRKGNEGLGSEERVQPRSAPPMREDIRRK